MSLKLVSLIGLPGSGKSTIGKHLARRLAFSFVDSDQVIESRLGCSIREYFEREGEDRFRDLEQQVMADLLTGEAPELVAVQSHGERAGLVISTGGGAVLRTANRMALRSGSQVVYLRASAEELFRRLRHDKTRPLLQVDDPLKRLRDLYAERDPLYQECAHFVVETGRPSVFALTNIIVSQLELSGYLQPHSASPTV